MLDYFLVSSPLAKAVCSVQVDDQAGVPPHRPVQLCFHPRLATLKHMAFRSPPPLPKSYPQPASGAVDWGPAAAAAAEALSRARQHSPSSITDAAPQDAYFILANAMGLEIVQSFRAAVQVLGTRGGMPRLVWQFVLPTPRQASQPQKDLDAARTRTAEWKWVVATSQELVMCPGKTQQSLEQPCDSSVRPLPGGHLPMLPWGMQLPIATPQNEQEANLLAEQVELRAADWEKAAWKAAAGAKQVSAQWWGGWAKASAEAGAGKAHRFAKLTARWEADYYLCCRREAHSRPSPAPEGKGQGLLGHVGEHGYDGCRPAALGAWRPPGPHPCATSSCSVSLLAGHSLHSRWGSSRSHCRHDGRHGRLRHPQSCH